MMLYVVHRDKSCYECEDDVLPWVYTTIDEALACPEYDDHIVAWCTDSEGDISENEQVVCSKLGGRGHRRALATAERETPEYRKKQQELEEARQRAWIEAALAVKLEEASFDERSNS